ncbi:MAG: amino acid permease [Acidobacteriota bacterium]|nr:amino acid permease [Acidobacteriota bacterium]
MPINQPQTQDGNEAGLRRELSAGQMAMVAVGGSIGTGLLLGSGAAIKLAGPSVIVSYVLAALIMGVVALAMGEMASVHPAAGSFGVYGELYLNPWAGFVSRYGYWLAMVGSIGSEMVAAATYARYWFPGVPAWVLVLGFGGLLVGVNLRPVRSYAWFEYWFAMLKVVTIVGFMALGAAFLGSGRVAPHYTADGGFFPHGMVAPLIATAFAIFTFGGVEMVAISSGEARSPQEVARATKIMFAMLASIYIGAITVLVGVMPWQQAGVAESPFVTVFRQAGLTRASDVMNFVVLTAALSGANASLYVAARMGFSLARTGYAPAGLGKLTRHGSPLRSLLASSAGIAGAAWITARYPETAFLHMLGVALFCGAIAWMVALAAHIVFRRRMSREQVAALALRVPGGAVSSALAFVGMGAAVCAMWVTPLRMTLTSGVAALAALTVAYFVTRGMRARAAIGQK